MSTQPTRIQKLTITLYAASICFALLIFIGIKLRQAADATMDSRSNHKPLILKPPIYHSEKEVCTVWNALYYFARHEYSGISTVSSHVRDLDAVRMNLEHWAGSAVAKNPFPCLLPNAEYGFTKILPPGIDPDKTPLVWWPHCDEGTKTPENILVIYWSGRPGYRSFEDVRNSLIPEMLANDS